MNGISASMAGYLRTIYYLMQTSGEGVRVSDIAACLDVKKSSVCNAVKSLSARRLALQDCNHRVLLTPEGSELAARIVDKLSIIKCFFVEVLCVEEKLAEMDACAIEHVVSGQTLCSMCRQLSPSSRQRLCSEDCRASGNGTAKSLA